MGCDAWITIKIFELVLSVVLIILKRVTDYDASRLFFLLQKLSYEWPLLNNVTWDEHGDKFVDITFGGFVIITLGLVIAAASGELRRRNTMETYFLVLGGLMFGAAGALILAAIDQVPPKLVDNAAALGVISLIAALLFFLDLCLASKRRKKSKPLMMATTASIPRVNISTQTYDPKNYVGPMFVTRTESPIQRFHTNTNINETAPKWMGDGESDGEFTRGVSPHGVIHHIDPTNPHPPPPPGFVHDTTPSRGFVLRTAQNWPRASGGGAKLTKQVKRTESAESRDDFNAQTDIHHEEIPRSIINTRVLHRWLNQRRDQNGSNLI